MGRHPPAQEVQFAINERVMDHIRAPQTGMAMSGKEAHGVDADHGDKQRDRRVVARGQLALARIPREEGLPDPVSCRLEARGTKDRQIIGVPACSTVIEKSNVMSVPSGRSQG
jgi:hypothetical protein